MKKRLAIFLSIMMVFAFGLAACGGNEAAEDAAEDAAEAAEETAEETADAAVTDENGYTGSDPVIAEVYDYLADDIAEDYYGADDDTVVSVPIVTVIDQTEGSNGEVVVKGDFWVFNYQVEGDTLKCISGGAHPGAMTLVKDDDDDNEYEVKSFDQVKDGGEYDASAKEIFGDKYEDFAAVSSDDTAREKLRGEILAAYVKANGLAVTKYQDEGWDPVDLPL